jgi:hypothetical protein
MFGIALCQNKKHIEFFFVSLLWMKENNRKKWYTLTPSRYDEIALSIFDFREMTLCPQNDQIN